MDSRNPELAQGAGRTAGEKVGEGREICHYGEGCLDMQQFSYRIKRHGFRHL